MGDEEYRQQLLTNVRSFMPFLEDLIKKLQNLVDSEEHPRNAQLTKIKSLYELLASKNKIEISVLQRCQEVLRTLHHKIKKDAVKDSNKTRSNGGTNIQPSLQNKISSDQESSQSTSASPLLMSSDHNEKCNNSSSLKLTNGAASSSIDINSNQKNIHEESGKQKNVLKESGKHKNVLEVSDEQKNVLEESGKQKNVFVESSDKKNIHDELCKQKNALEESSKRKNISVDSICEQKTHNENCVPKASNIPEISPERSSKPNNFIIVNSRVEINSQTDDNVSLSRLKQNYVDGRYKIIEEWHKKRLQRVPYNEHPYSMNNTEDFVEKEYEVSPSIPKESIEKSSVELHEVESEKVPVNQETPKALQEKVDSIGNERNINIKIQKTRCKNISKNIKGLNKMKKNQKKSVKNGASRSAPWTSPPQVADVLSIINNTAMLGLNKPQQRKMMKGILDEMSEKGWRQLQSKIGNLTNKYKKRKKTKKNIKANNRLQLLSKELKLLMKPREVTPKLPKMVLRSRSSTGVQISPVEINEESLNNESICVPPDSVPSTSQVNRSQDSIVENFPRRLVNESSENIKFMSPKEIYDIIVGRCVNDEIIQDKSTSGQEHTISVDDNSIIEIKHEPIEDIANKDLSKKISVEINAILENTTKSAEERFMQEFIERNNSLKIEQIPDEMIDENTERNHENSEPIEKFVSEKSAEEKFMQEFIEKNRSLNETILTRSLLNDGDEILGGNSSKNSNDDNKILDVSPIFVPNMIADNDLREEALNDLPHSEPINLQNNDIDKISIRIGTIRASLNNENDIIYECFEKGCIFQSKDEADFQIHNHCFHMTNKWDGYCNICDKTVESMGLGKFYKSFSQMDCFRHLIAMHKSDLRIGESFLRIDGVFSVVNNDKDVTENEIPPGKSYKKGFTSNNKMQFSRHMISHDNPNVSVSQNSIGTNSESLEKSQIDNETVKPTGLSPDILLKCAKCSVVFQTSTEYKTHIMLCMKKKDYKCAHCPMRFHAPYHLIGHIRLHGTLRFGCGVCKYRSTITQDMNKHMKFVHKFFEYKRLPVDPSKTSLELDLFVYMPKIQETLVPLLTSLNIHEACDNIDLIIDSSTQENMPKIPLVSSIESNIQKTSDNTDEFINIDSSTRENMPKIPLVPSIESNIRETSDNIDEFISIDSSTQECSCIVNNTTSCSSQLCIAQQISADSTSNIIEDDTQLPRYIIESKRLQCNIQDCPFLTDDEETLKQHYLTSHINDFVACPHCKVSVEDIDGLITHLRFHGKRLYKCPCCAFYHYQRQPVENHVNSEHPDCTSISVIRREEQMTRKSRNVFACGVCDFKSSEREIVRKHVAEEHDTRSRYKCALCDFKSSCKDTHERHFELRHDGKPVEMIRMIRWIYSSAKKKIVKRKKSNDVDDINEGTVDEDLNSNAEKKNDVIGKDVTENRCEKEYNDEFDSKKKNVKRKKSYNAEDKNEEESLAEKKRNVIGKDITETRHVREYNDKKNRNFDSSPMIYKKDQITNQSRDVWSCGICDFKSSDRTRVKEHVAKEHNTKSKYKCALCDFKSSCKSKYENHFELCHEGRPVEMIKMVKWIYSRRDSEICKNNNVVEEEYQDEERENVGLDFSYESFSTSSCDTKKCSSSSSDVHDNSLGNIDIEIQSEKEYRDKQRQKSFKKKKRSKLIDDALENSAKRECLINNSFDDSLSSENIPSKKRKMDDTAPSPKTSKKNGTHSSPKLSTHLTQSNNDMESIYNSEVSEKQKRNKTKIDKIVPSPKTSKKNKTIRSAKISTRRYSTESISTETNHNPEKRKQDSSDSIILLDSFSDDSEDDDVMLVQSPRYISKLELPPLLEEGDYGAPKDGKYCCPVCETFCTSNEDEMRNHLYDELDYAKYSCSVCETTSGDLVKLREQCERKHPNDFDGGVIRVMPSDPYVEDWVGSVIKHQNAIIKKEKSRKADDDIPKPPIEVSQKDENHTFLNNTNNKEINNPDIVYLCNYCPKRGATNAEIYQHWKVTHAIPKYDKLGNITRDFLSFKYKMTTAWELFKKNGGKSNNKRMKETKYVCRYCGKKGNKDDLLVHHNKMHGSLEINIEKRHKRTKNDDSPVSKSCDDEISNDESFPVSYYNTKPQYDNSKINTVIMAGGKPTRMYFESLEALTDMHPRLILKDVRHEGLLRKKKRKRI